MTPFTLLECFKAFKGTWNFSWTQGEVHYRLMLYLFICDQESQSFSSLGSYWGHRKQAVGYLVSISHWLGGNNGLKTIFHPAEWLRGDLWSQGGRIGGDYTFTFVFVFSFSAWLSHALIIVNFDVLFFLKRKRRNLGGELTWGSCRRMEWPGFLHKVILYQLLNVTRSPKIPTLLSFYGYSSVLGDHSEFWDRKDAISLSIELTQQFARVKIRSMDGQIPTSLC